MTKQEELHRHIAERAHEIQCGCDTFGGDEDNPLECQYYSFKHDVEAWLPLIADAWDMGWNSGVDFAVLEQEQQGNNPYRIGGGL